ncbi:MAG: hypothetical protein H6704_14740 [Myxococcales bacterium]|nr:hypothetical protein [Myxococcales bacterium]
MKTTYALILALLALGCDDDLRDAVLGDADTPDGAAPATDAAPDARPRPDAWVPPDAGAPIAARRLLTWVCDTTFARQATLADLELAPVAGDGGAIAIEPTEEPCQFHLLHRDVAGATRLTDVPGGYLLAAGVADGAARVVCASRIDHRPAAQATGSGQKRLRQTYRVRLECARGEAGQFTALQPAVPPSPDWAPWISTLETLPDQPGRYRVTYERDFSFQFLNLTDHGRPEEDGTYTVDFGFDADGTLVAGDPDRAAPGMAGGPTGPAPDPCPPGEIDPSDPRCAPRCGDGTCDPSESCGDCADDCGPCSLVVDDGDDPGYAEIAGAWRTTAGRADFSRFTDDGVATFDFRGLLPGPKEVWVHHPVDPRATDRALYRVREGADDLRAEVALDQRVGGGDWRLAGVVDTRGDFVVEVAQGGRGRLYADAVRVEAVVDQDPVIDDGDGRYREQGDGWTTAPGGEGGAHRRSATGGATYTARIQPGVHEVWLTWPADQPTATRRAEVTLTADGAFVATLTLDQQREGGAWLSLGRYRLNGQQATLTLRATDGAPVLADAVRFDSVAALPDGAEFVTDDGDARYLETGMWADADAEGAGGDVRWSPAGDGTATWQFGGLPPDFYDVLVQFPAAPRNTNAAVYTVRSAGAELVSASLDQTSGEGWRVVGRVWIAAPTASVTLRREAAGALRADVVKLVSTRCVECER